MTISIITLFFSPQNILCCLADFTLRSSFWQLNGDRRKLVKQIDLFACKYGKNIGKTACSGAKKGGFLLTLFINA